MRTLMPRLAPSSLLAAAAAVALLFCIAAYLVATHQPWLGIEFKPNLSPPGLLVMSVDHSSPNQQLKAGDVVTALASKRQSEAFEEKLLPLGEVDLPTFAIFNRYVAHHRAVWEILTSGDFEFVLLDGRHIPGGVLPKRPEPDLPWQFWLLALSGSVAFLIGIGIWVYRPELPAAPLIAIGAVGSLLAALLAGLFASRELTLSPFWLRASIDEMNIGSEVLVYAFVALLWYYPAPRYRFPVATLCTLFVLLIWANESLQLADLPLNTYVLHYLFAYTAGVLLAVHQWRQTRDDAVSRAALQWYLLTIILSFGTAVLLTFIPLVYIGQAFMPKYATFFIPPVLYVGLAFGIARYRLFDIERWWLEVWLWLGGGLLVIAIDAVLMTLLHVTGLLALGVAVVLAGWVYFPLRQWLFRRLLRPTRTRLDDHFPLLVETLFRDGAPGSFGDRWRDLLQRVFAPAALTARATPATQAMLAESGLTLHVPSFEGNETHELRFREQGRRLYSRHDAALADTLLSLTRRVAALWQAREEGARAERGRIMRDLHDDVGSRLLSLVHCADDADAQNQSREALAALRYAIYALDDSRPMTLSDLMVELQALVRARLRDTGVALDWLEPPVPPEVNLSPRQRINLTRVVQEALANALRHAAPAAVRVRWGLNDGSVSLHLCNDGAILRTEDWQTGKGTANIRARMMELGGEAQWNVTSQNSSPVCCLRITFPLT